MSVLKENRSLSKAEFVKESRDITIRTINLLSRLSARYARVLADDVKRCTMQCFMYCVRANSVYPTSFQRCNLREEYLLRAKADLDALDGALAIIYEILRTNPEGAFTDSSGKKSLDIKRANDKLDKMVDILGDAVDREQALLTGQLEFVRKSRRSIFNNTVGNYIKKGRTREEAVKLAQIEKGVQLQTVESIKNPMNETLEFARILKEYDEQNKVAMAEEITPDFSKPENEIEVTDNEYEAGIESVEGEDKGTVARPVPTKEDSKRVQVESVIPSFVITEDTGKLDNIFLS